ncbi:MAG: selenocysteine-specific translation elongation factor [Vulcanimicrobiota bacterium]
MANYVMGTAGHIDHGKSSLIRALTGIETDRLPEEKARGMSIDLGFAHMTLPSGHVLGIVDVPGHERFLRNMLTGVGGIDIAMLVVDAVEGIKPQTVEHTDILNLLAIKGGLVALNKIDLIDSKDFAEKKESIESFLSGTFLEGAPVNGISALTGEGKKELVSTIDALLATIPPRDPQGEYRLPIDRIFIKQGFGTIVAGSLLSGTVRKGDRVVLMPQGMECKVRALQVYNREASSASAGQRVALNLSGLDRREIKRGNEICPPDVFTPTNLFDGKINVLLNTPHPLRNNMPVRIYLGTGEYLGKMRLLQGSEIALGDDGFVQVLLEESCVCRRGDRFIVRNSSALYTIGGGVILDPYPERHRKGKDQVIKILEKRDSGDLEEVVMSHFLSEKGALLSSGDLAKRVQIPDSSLREVLDSLVHKGILISQPGKGVFFHRTSFEEAKSILTSTLEKLEKAASSRAGWKKDEIVKASGIEKKEIMERVIETFIDEKLLCVKGGGLLARNDYRPVLEGKLEALHMRLLNMLRENEFSPEFRADLIKKLSTDDQSFRLIEEFMMEAGELCRITPEFLMLRSSVERARELISRHFESQNTINPSQTRDILKTSRKYIIPILEYFDQIHFTRRVGDVRVLFNSAG